MLKQCVLSVSFAAIALVAALPACAEDVKASYTCKVTPDGKVVVAVTNPNAFAIFCTVNCHFKIPGGSTSMSCSRSVPASVADQELCTKSTGGTKYTLSDGNLECNKQ